MAIAAFPKLRTAIIASLRREFQIAGRNFGELAKPWVFFLAIAVFLPLAISPEPHVLRVIAPGMVWIIALLSVLLSLEHMFQRDFENGCLEQILISGQSAYWLVSVKTFAHWLFTGLPLTLFSPVLAMMLSLPGSGYATLFWGLLFGTVALSYIGSIGAAVTVALRRGGLLISLVIIPFYMPVLIFGAASVRNAVDGVPALSQLLILASFGLASILFAPVAASTALKVGLRD
jgi:heme exporter protein B